MRTRKGFTLIELMIVIAIIAIIAAIAIPNLMQSRIRANEATAISALKNYVNGQVTFQVGKQGRVATNTSSGNTGYADNFRNLFYGNPVSGASAADSQRQLELISQNHADAFVTATPKGTGVVATAALGPVGVTGTAAAYNGYLFDNPVATDYATSYASATDFYALDFAQIAVPGTAGTTGNNMYFVGQSGMVYMQGAKSGDVASTLADTSTPLNTSSLANWMMN